jgi:lipid A 3-O-deacylase
LSWFRRFAVGAALALTAGSAGAETKLVDELLVGVLYHDAGVFGDHKEPGADFNGEIRFVSPDLLKAIWAPRPHLGVSVNSAGATSQAYTGLTWTFTLARGLASSDDSLFLDASLGGSVHDGSIRSERSDRKELGSRFLFRESLEFGWAFTPRQSISILLDHVSNANLGVKNAGLDNLGVRYGIRF